MRAQYYGMISEVDAQLGRVVDAIEARGEWDDTLVVVTSDHGEQLGDHGLVEKLGFFPQSYHVIGLWRDPRRADAGAHDRRASPRTSTCCRRSPTALGSTSRSSATVVRWTPLIANGEGAPWRTAAHYEWDYRCALHKDSPAPWPQDRTLIATESRGLAG